MVLVTLVLALASLLYQFSHQTGSVKLPLISVREDAGKRDRPASCEEDFLQEPSRSPASCDFIQEEREQAGRVATLQQQCHLWKKRLGRQPSFDNGYIQRLRQIT